MNTEEIFKDIPGWKDVYQVSTKGNIRSKTRFGEYKVLKPILGNQGYTQVSLCIPGARKKVHIHRMVAEIFIPNPENKPIVNHKNGVKHDNCIENLEWSSYSENLYHAYETGLLVCKKGQDHHLSKLTLSQITEIRININKVSQKVLADIYNVSQSQISRIILKKEWKSL